MWYEGNSHLVLAGVDIDTPILENCLAFYCKAKQVNAL